jgi:hypothetical protein
VTDLASARQFALSLPGAGEKPHFDMASFRVGKKIFATVPPDNCHLHVFVGEDEIEACVAENPGAFEPLRWGQQARGLRILLAQAAGDRVAELLAKSWRRKASKRLVAEFDAAGGLHARPDPP